MAQRFKAKTLLSNSGVFNNEVIAPNLVYNTGNQTISGQKRFIDEDIYISFTNLSLNEPSTFLGGYSGPGTHRFISRQDYRPYVFPNPQHYYSGLNTSPHVEIYYNTGTSRWWFTYNNILQDASPIVSPSQAARLPLTNWSGGNMRIYPIYSHNISHYIDGKDPIDPNLIGAVALTGNQTISGVKTFATGVVVSGNLQVSGTGIFNAIDLNNIDNLSLSGVDITITSGNVTLTNRPTVNGTGVLLSGEAGNLPNTVVYTTGNQTISGTKTFAQTGSFDTLQITNKKLSSYSLNSTNFIFGDNYLNFANSSTNITGTLPSGIVSGINYYAKNLNSGIFFISGSGSRTIDGFSTLNLYKNESVQLVGVNTVGYTGWVTISADGGIS